MPLTIKQENFARQYVGACEGNASAAYRAVYRAGNCNEKTVRKRASELLANGDVTGMVVQLKEEQAEGFAITMEEITAGLRRTITAATAAGQHSAATQAMLGLAKLGGLLVEKRHISVDDAREHLDAVVELSAVPRPASPTIQ